MSANGVTRTTFHATVRAESRNCSHELRALGSDHGNHRSRGWLAPLIHAATDFFPPPFYRSPRHRLDLERELFALLRFNVSSGSGCRRSISPGTMVTRSVIRHACIRRFAVSTPLYICIYIYIRGFPLLLFLIISFHTLSLSITWMKIFFNISLILDIGIRVYECVLLGARDKCILIGHYHHRSINIHAPAAFANRLIG